MDIEARLRPLLAKLVAELEPIIGELVRERLVAAIDSIAGQRDLKPEKPHAPKGNPGGKGTKKIPTCSVCEQKGHNARSCSKRSVSPPPVSHPTASRADRFAAIEAAANARRSAGERMDS